MSLCSYVIYDWIWKSHTLIECHHYLHIDLSECAKFTFYFVFRIWTLYIITSSGATGFPSYFLLHIHLIYSFYHISGFIFMFINYLAWFQFHWEIYFSIYKFSELLCFISKARSNTFSKLNPQNSIVWP